LQLHITSHDLEINPEEFFDVFYEGRRLRKNSIDKFNPTLALDSVDGDEVLPPEFSVNGNILTINVPNPDTGLYEENYIPPANKQVFVIRKHGKVWNDPDTALSKSNNNIANFLRSGSIKFIE